jgi:hypothetical protein
MRYLLLSAIALLVACAGPDQTRSLPEGVSDAAAPREATTVTVRPKTSAQQAYRATARVLQSEGYALANTDSDLRSITTGRKSAEPNGILVGLPDHRITASVTASPTTIELRGTSFHRGSQAEIKKYGQSGSPQRLAWARLVELGHLVAEETGGEIGFEK